MNTNEHPNFVWKLAFVWMWFMTTFVWRVTVEGKENLPLNGGFILCPNHVSLMDPPLIAYYLYPRPVHYWSKAELSKVPVLSWLLRWMYTIPIQRGTADREAIDRAVNVLLAGNIVGSFPEGSRHSDEVKRGSAFVAKKAKSLLVPCGIVWEGRRVIIRFGTPLHPEGTTRTITTELDIAMKALL